MTALKLYVSPGSAPSRSVLFMWNHLLARLEVDHECEVYAIDLQKGEHKTPEFLAINPSHTVPTLSADGHGVWESRALMGYLCELAGGHSAYPWEPEIRAELNRLLMWDLGTFYKAVGGAVYPQVFEKTPAASLMAEREKLKDALSFLEGYQLGDGRPFLLGDTWTLADVTIAFGLTMTDMIDEPGIGDFRRIAAWRERMSELPHWGEVNAPFEAWKTSLLGEGPGDEDAPTEAAPHEDTKPLPTGDGGSDESDEGEADSDSAKDAG